MSRCWGGRPQRELFGEGFDAEGERVTIGDRSFTVAGVVRTTDADQDETRVHPARRGQTLLNIRHLQHDHRLAVEQAGDATRVGEEITALLRQRHAQGTADGPRAVGLGGLQGPGARWRSPTTSRSRLRPPRT